MARVTPEQYADKWNRRIKAAVPDIQAGVQRVTTSPGEAAALKQDKMLQRVTEAITSGKWAERVRSVTVEDWRRAALNKGIPRIAAGADGATDKMREFASQLLPYLDRVVSEVQRMPDLTLEDAIARATHVIREMSKFRKR
jgi:hypothetical protein